MGTGSLSPRAVAVTGRNADAVLCFFLRLVVLCLFHSIFRIPMLKKIVILSVLVVLPIAVYMGVQYGQMKSVVFSEAVQMAQGHDDAEKAPKVLIRGQIVGVATNPVTRSDNGWEFTVRDATMQDFPVVYTGEEMALQYMQTIAVAGHVHGSGEAAYFHASEIIVNY